MEKAIDLVSTKHFSLREASKKTGVAITSLQRKIKNPARIPLPLGSTSYLTLSEIEALADTLKSPEHAENGVTLPVLKSLVLTLLEGKNRVPPSGSVSDSFITFLYLLPTNNYLGVIRTLSQRVFAATNAEAISRQVASFVMQ